MKTMAMMVAEPKPVDEEKLNFKRILPVFVVVLVDLLGLSIIIPLLPIYAASYGANPFVIGLIGASYPLMQFIGAPVLGSLSDRYGRKPVLLISQMGTLLGFILLGAANMLWLVFVSRIIDGLSGANISTAQAMIHDHTNEKTRTQGLGLIGAAFGIGFTLGPIIAFTALGLSHNNYHVPAFVAAACSLGSILLTSFWLKESLPQGKPVNSRNKGSLRSFLSFSFDSKLTLLLTLVFLQQLCFGGFEQLFALFTLSKLGINAAGNAIIFVFIGILLVLVQGRYIGPLSRRLGDKKLVRFGLAMLALGLVLSALTPAITVPWYSRSSLIHELTTVSQVATGTALSVPLPSGISHGWLGLLWLMAAMIPTAIGGGVLQPGLNSIVTKSVQKAEVGRVLGTSTALVSAANVCGPLLGGLIFQVLGVSAPFMAFGAVIGLLFCCSFYWI